MAVAIPKDDWTPAKLKTHREWRKRMFAAASVKEIPVKHVEAVIAPSYPQVPVERGGQVVVTVNFGFPMLPVNEYKAFRMKAIQKACCAAAGISMSELLCDDRSRRLLKPRHIAMMLCRMFGGIGATNAVIGKHFSGRDHTTVLHATRKLSPVREAIERRVPKTAPLNEHVAAAFDAYDELIVPRMKQIDDEQRQRIAARNRLGQRWSAA